MNCIWITLDSFRQDHVHCYAPQGASDPAGAGFVVQTPNLDRLAREGLKCLRLRSEALPTIPCRRGIFTGQRVFPWRDEPPRKGLYLSPSIPGWRPLREEDVTVAEHLAEQGYVCAMIVDVYHLMKPSQNFHRGFHCFEWIRGQEYDQWHTQPLPAGYLESHLKPGIELSPARLRVLTQYLKNQMYREGDEDYQAARVFRAAIEWLEANHGHEHFFLYIDSFDPHEPHEAPRRFVDLYDPDWDGPDLIYGNMYRRDQLSQAEHRHLRAQYAAECSMVDYWVGQLLDAVDRLGLRENTLIVLVADHGKIMGEWNHYGMPPQDTGLELNAVPCLLRHPAGERAGEEFADWVYNTDVTATTLDLLGVPPKPATDGQSFWAAAGNDGSFRDHAVTGHGPMVACWEGDWLYLVDTERDTEALYNLAEDPQRQKDVADRYPADRDRLLQRLRAVAEGARG